MLIEQMKVLLQRFEAMLNTPDMSIAEEIFAPHFVAHFPLTPALTRSNFKNFIQSFYDAFPDFIMEINDSIITCDHMVLRVTYYGTHKGDFLGIAATGYQITMPGISIFRVENDLVVENWTEIDVFGVVRQISQDSLLGLPSAASGHDPVGSKTISRNPRQHHQLGDEIVSR